MKNDHLSLLSQNPPMVAPVYYVEVPAPAVTKPNGSHAAPYVWQGKSKAEVARQNVIVAGNVGANDKSDVLPPKGSNAKQFWCRELDGAYTLRSLLTIEEALQPGHWAVAKAGHPYFVRTTS